MHPRSATEQLVIKPSSATYLKGVGRRAWIAPIVVVIALINLGDPRDDVVSLIGVITIGLAFVVSVAGVALYFVRSQVIVGNGLSWTPFLSPRRHLEPHQIGSFLVVDKLSVPMALEGRLPHLWVLDANGRRRLRLSGAIWAHEDMHRLAERLHGDGVQGQHIPEASAKEMAKHRPELFTWAQRHPGWVVAISIIATLVLVGLLTVLVLATSG